MNIDECDSHPCENGGQCKDEINGYTCKCVPGFSGENCGINDDDCTPNPCSHGKCDDDVNDFTCTCEAGYTGKQCDKDINECESDPCQNGECVDLVNSYQCQCKEGFTGKNCETDIDYCHSNPCQNGAQCNEEPTGYSCTCADGYTGDDCSEDIDDCKPEPCVNGQCFDAVNDYSCVCEIGYQGKNCGEDIDECEGDPCHNGAKCIDKNGDFECECVEGYSGRYCQTNDDDCGTSPCNHGGTCEDGIASFTCTCEDGWTGHTCNIDIDDCEAKPCKNGGTCKDAVNGFSCECADGFEGELCGQDHDDCEPNPCQYSGTCKDKVNGYVCQCKDGFSGENCETNDNECLSHPCANGGQCTDGIADFTCECAEGYKGKTCEDNPDDCVEGACKNGGQCIDGLNTYHCECSAGYEGDDCSTNTDDCEGDTCANDGECEDLVDDFRCVCTPGYEGKRCSHEINECNSSPCQNGGECIDGIAQYKCNCQPGFEGDNCDQSVVKPPTTAVLPKPPLPPAFTTLPTLLMAEPPVFETCDDYPCENGECKEEDSVPSCECEDGFKGQYCDEEMKPCDTYPCKNGATCDDSKGEVTCTCQEGWTGPTCAEEINECDSEPCQNGVCDDRFNDFYCECEEGYGGKRCDQPATACLSDPCHHGGTCHDMGDYYTCDCPAGLTGCECEDPVDMCESNPCEHGGVCKNHKTSFECECAFGYTGEVCEQEESVSGPVPAGDAHPLDEFLLTGGSELPNFDYEVYIGITLEQCGHVCLGEKTFLCRSIEMRKDGSCALQKHTPFTSGHALHSNPDKKYLERIIPGSLQCNFEAQEICGYLPQKVDTTFTRFTGPTNAARTGPESDHTTGSGFYMYMPVKLQHPESIGRLFSPVSHPIDTTLTFFYHNYGSGAERPLGGTLKVYRVPEGASPEDVDPIWVQQGSESIDWLKAQVPLQSDVPFQIVFEGVRGPTQKSEVAIDDVEITNNPTPDSLTCNFDDPYRCGYTSDPQADFNWYWQDGPTPTPNTGPDVDHTTGTQDGHFMYAEPSDRLTGQHARLLSPVSPPYNGPIEFYYHMDCGGTLNVYVKAVGADINSPVWDKDGDFGNTWLHGVIEVNSDKDFQLVFEAIRGENDCSDVAIDDVRIPSPGEVLSPEDDPKPGNDDEPRAPVADLEDLEPGVQPVLTKDGVIIICSSSHIVVQIPSSQFGEVSPYDLNWRDGSCKGSSMEVSSKEYYLFRTELDGCDTESKTSEDDSYILYINDIKAGDDVLHRVECKYDRMSNVEAQIIANPCEKGVTETGFGSFVYYLTIFKGPDFSDPINALDFPVEVCEDEPMYFGVGVRSGDKNLEVFVDQCFAANTADAKDAGSYFELISSGCLEPFVQEVPSNSLHEHWFKANITEVVKAESERFFLHCSVLVCRPGASGSRCGDGCISNSVQRRSIDEYIGSSKATTISHGPMRVKRSSEEANSTHHFGDPAEVTAAVSSMLFAVTLIALLVTIKKRRNDVSNLRHDVESEKE
ncbi:uncharacterized protein LOC144436922 [Glandiceps talaboti]